MDFVKKEWKTIALILCLIGLIIFLSQINNQLNVISKQNAKLISTLDSVESVSISTDANINDIRKKVDGIDAGMTYTVQKLRRR